MWHKEAQPFYFLFLEWSGVTQNNSGMLTFLLSIQLMIRKYAYQTTVGDLNTKKLFFILRSSVRVFVIRFFKVRAFA